MPFGVGLGFRWLFYRIADPILIWSVREFPYLVPLNALYRKGLKMRQVTMSGNRLLKSETTKMRFRCGGFIPIFLKLFLEYYL